MEELRRFARRERTGVRAEAHSRNPERLSRWIFVARGHFCSIGSRKSMMLSRTWNRELSYPTSHSSASSRVLKVGKSRWEKVLKFS
jgi:hypothetical protein